MCSDGMLSTPFPVILPYNTAKLCMWESEVKLCVLNHSNSKSQTFKQDTAMQHYKSKVKIFLENIANGLDEAMQGQNTHTHTQSTDVYLH